MSSVIPRGKEFCTGSTFLVKSQDLTFDVVDSVGLTSGGTFDIFVVSVNVESESFDINSGQVGVTATDLDVNVDDDLEIDAGFINVNGGTGISMEAGELIVVHADKIILDPFELGMSGITITINAPTLIFNEYHWPVHPGDTGDILIQTGASGLTFTTIEKEVQKFHISNRYFRRPVGSGETAILPGDDIIAHIGSSGLTLNLPEVSSLVAGTTYNVYTVVDEGGNATNRQIDIVAYGSDTILGVPYFTLNRDFNAVRLYHDETTGWFVM